MAQASLDSIPLPTPGARLVSVDGRTYPLESARIEARAEGGIAVSTLRQTFRNSYAEPLETLYTLPLPADGVVVGYTVRLGDRTIVGEVRRREEARREFEQALFEGRSAALLEQDRDDTFQQRLGSLPPGTDAHVEIRVLHPLTFVPAAAGSAPRWEYRFPTVVGVRYSGEPGRVADSGRLEADRGFEIPTRFDVQVVLADGDPLATACDSPSHRLVLSADGKTTVVALESSEKLDRDLVLRWTACGADVGLQCVEGRGLRDDDGRYALLTLTPPRVAARSMARDLTLLIDASGSMEGGPLRWATAIATDVLRHLEAHDRFEVLAFSNQPVRLTSGLVPAVPRNLSSAIQALDALQAGGGTEMLDAIVAALTPLRDDAQRQVILITDGQIGFESEVVGEILGRLPENSRVHAVGVGPAPTRSLTRGVAQAGRGAEILIGSDGEVALASHRLQHATARPVLVDVTVGGSALLGDPPDRLHDVLAGAPLSVAVELHPGGGTLEVRGRLADGEPWVQVLDVAARAADLSTVAPLGAWFGRQRIAECELRAAADGADTRQYDLEIEALGLRHHVTSRRTSLVAYADEPSVDPRAPRRRMRLPVELPAGLSAGMLGVRYRPMRSPLACEAAPRASYDLLRPDSESRIPADLHFGRLLELEAAELDGPSTEEPDDPRSEIRGRVLESGAFSLVLEFEIPEDGFVLPGEVGVVFENWEEMYATVREGDSSPVGPHAKGLVVRLALSCGASLPERACEVRVELDESYVVVAALEPPVWIR